MLGNKITSEMYEREQFVKVANNMGIDFDVVFSDEIDLLVSRDDRRSIRYKGEAIALPDVCLARTGSGTGFYNLSVLRQLERLNVLTLPNSAAIESSKDKFYSNQILAQAGLPIPKTMLARFPVSEDLIESQIGFPCVIKVVTGSHGAGVYLCETQKQFQDLQELIASLDSKNSMIIQEYVEESAGRDLRLIVVGGKVIGAIERTSTDGNFRANISRGGEGKAFPLDEEMEMLALQVSRVLDLDICGVDLLFSDDGYKICEANSAPGFQGFEQATGINVPEKIFKYAGIRI